LDDRGSIPGRGRKIFSLLCLAHTGPEAHAAIYTVDTGSSFLTESAPSSAEEYLELYLQSL